MSFRLPAGWEENKTVLKVDCIRAGLSEARRDAEGNIIKTGKQKTTEIPTEDFLWPSENAIRENVQTGVPTGVAMKISGHKTMSVFEQYSKTDSKDLKREAEMRRFRLRALQAGGVNNRRAVKMILGLKAV